MQWAGNRRYWCSVRRIFWQKHENHNFVDCFYWSHKLENQGISQEIVRTDLNLTPRTLVEVSLLTPTAVFGMKTEGC